MSVQVRRRRDTSANVAAFTGAPGELVVDTTNNRVVLQDGVTAGGWPAAKLSEVVTNTRTSVADATYAVTPTDRLVAFTALTAARTVTLCAASTYPLGARLMIFDEAGACSATKTITITRVGTDTIDGATSFTINAAYAGLEIESNGSNAWTILSPAPNVIASLVGVGTPPDPANPLSVYGASALFNGANFSVTVNKSASANTASFVFQDGFSGRAQIGLNGSDNFSFKVSPNGSTWTTGISLDATTGAPTFANQRTAVADAAYSVLTTDRLVAYTALTAARVASLPSAAAFPAGHLLTVLDESGACSASLTITVVRAGADTINGGASATLSSAFGFVTLQGNGANKWIVVKRSCNVQAFSASGTYTPTPGMTLALVMAFGAGGGGGGGALQSASAAVSGGAGGGGGAMTQAWFTAAQIGASQSVTIGSAGTAGAAATSSSTAAAAGGQGGATTFGTLLKAFGGGGGAGGQLAAASGGGGGSGYTTASSGSGSAAGGAGIGGGAGATGAGASAAALGGGAGGAGSPAIGAAGGNGQTGAGGGGSGGAGGGVSAANVANIGGNGGANAGAGYPEVTAVTGGAINTAGTAGGAPTAAMAMQLGGGGGSGGGSMTNGGTARAGGAGGTGALYVIEYF